MQWKLKNFKIFFIFYPYTLINDVRLHFWVKSLIIISMTSFYFSIMLWCSWLNTLMLYSKCCTSVLSKLLRFHKDNLWLYSWSKFSFLVVQPYRRKFTLFFNSKYHINCITTKIIANILKKGWLFLK